MTCLLRPLRPPQNCLFTLAVPPGAKVRSASSDAQAAQLVARCVTEYLSTSAPPVFYELGEAMLAQRTPGSGDETRQLFIPFTSVRVPRVGCTGMGGPSVRP